MPKSAIKCIDSWKRYLPDYEIKEWNEENFDINVIPYTREAYTAKKYAFVSDYARFWILYNFGGVYFDTDVELIRPLDHIIEKGAFMGREAGAYFEGLIGQGGRGLGVAPGLGLGAEAGMAIYRELLDCYSGVSFINSDGSLNTKTIVFYTTEVLCRKGLSSNNGTIETIDGINVYPADYFCPMDHTRGCQLKITPNTVSIHHYDSSWNDHKTMHYKLHRIKNLLMRLLGPDRVEKLLSVLRRR